MATLLTAFIAALKPISRIHAALQLENLSPRHQIGVLGRSAKKRPKLTSVDRFFWAWPSILADWLTGKGRPALAANST
jgi:hypothetical protein